MRRWESGRERERERGRWRVTYNKVKTSSFRLFLSLLLPYACLVRFGFIPRGLGRDRGEGERAKEKIMNVSSRSSSASRSCLT